MKKTLLLLTFLLGASYSAFAAPCGVDTLSNYILTGSCNIGDVTFVFNSLSYSSSGSIDIPASDVKVTPIMGSEFGFRFNAPWFAFPSSGAPNILDSFINYTASCDAACKLDDWALAIGGASAPGDSAINVSETAAELSGSLAVGSLGGKTTTMDSGMFAPTDSLTLSKDIIVYGGTSTPNGLFAQVSSVSNLFSLEPTSKVPEPSLSILCLGLLGLVPVARRKFVR
jgi:hypothetical protein